MRAEEIRVRGTVQGVGFRPTVWRLARECGITGEVLNDADGVLIRAWGEPSALKSLADRIANESPPLARIDSISRVRVVGSVSVPLDFTIAISVDGRATTSVAADAATCQACKADIEDPANRRYRYPFTNCTHCGPRLSIVESIPYDRARTSMKAFPMCADCEREYANPADRRFHAQPNACPACGPRAWLEDGNGRPLALGDDCDAVAAAARWVAEGRIVAIKGIGGFHLACDATNAATVAMLRTRKHRYAKALAMMARDADVIRRYAALTAEHQALLESPAAPIVVMPAAGRSLPDAIAPGQDTLGFMLPYTPLHHLLMAGFEHPVVMTSGNLSDEPQVIDNAVARSRLCHIADAFLMHDRDIVNRLDDSVVTVVDGMPSTLRRARGHAPEPVSMPAGFESSDGVLAMGGELKNTFCLLAHGQAIVSQHIGDMEERAALIDAEQNLDLYKKLFDFEPGFVAVDRHPEYLPTKQALKYADASRIVPVQHHHAHVAACLAEHGRPLDSEPVLGIVLDGLGYGDDDDLWGGEFLVADYRAFRRAAHFLPVALPGAAKAMREPWRNTWAHLDAALGWENVVRQYGHLECIRWLAGQPVHTFAAMLARGINSPPASSAGRLFDALAGALDVCRERQSHEAEAAMSLEALARSAMPGVKESAYSVLVGADAVPVMSFAPLWRAVLDDLGRGTPRAVISARFHAGLAAGIAALAIALARREGLGTVVLTGGVFQNTLLSSAVQVGITAAGFEVLVPAAYPANDGGLSLGQAAVAAAVIRAEG